MLLHFGYELTENFFLWVEKLMYKNEGLKRLRKILWMRIEKWEMRNKKWKMRNGKWG